MNANLERASQVARLLAPPEALNRAIPPNKPFSPKTMMSTALGLVLGGMLGVFWVFLAGWWRGSDEEEKAL